MKKFKVTVNGKSYEVDVEELGTAAPAAPVTPAPAPVAAASPAPTPAPAPAASATSSATQAAPKGPIPDSAVVVKAPCPEKFQLLSRKAAR